MLSHAILGHCAEFGMIASRGAADGRTPRGSATSRRQRFPELARDTLLMLVDKLATTVALAAAPWLRSLLDRRPARIVTVAMANKTARIVWAVLARGEAYRPPVAA